MVSGRTKLDFNREFIGREASGEAISKLGREIQALLKWLLEKVGESVGPPNVENDSSG